MREKHRGITSVKGLGIVYCVVFPLTLFILYAVLHVRNYYFLSICLAVFAVLPAFALYENDASEGVEQHKKAPINKIVLVATFTALTVASRAAFFWVPQLKPMMAIVILAGVGFGPQMGYLVGVFSAFCSNFIFGQGPWTPFQMAAFGIMGFIAGLFFYGRYKSKQRWLLCVFGLVGTYIVYGGIVNFYSTVAFVPQLTWGAFFISYSMAIPFDMAHSAGTAFFLFVLSDIFLKRIERLRVKYGMSFD